MSQPAVRNITAAKQFVDFSTVDLACGKQATDIDFSTDIQGRLFLFGDFKQGNAPCPTGQRYHLGAKVDAIRGGVEDGRPSDACAFIARHSTPWEDDLNPTTALVTEYYWNRGEWTTCREPVPFVVFCDGMVERMSPLVFPF